jgi:hypothetical protein
VPAFLGRPIVRSSTIPHNATHDGETAASNRSKKCCGSRVKPLVGKLAGTPDDAGRFLVRAPIQEDLRIAAATLDPERVSSDNGYYVY